MARWRFVLILLAGLMLVASSAAHSLLGWPEVRQELETAGVKGELAVGLHVGWQLGGAAMLAFGAIVMATLLRCREHARQAPPSRVPAAVTLPASIIGIVYLAFGAWALQVSDLNPFFLVFVVPGALLVTATLRFPGNAP